MRQIYENCFVCGKKNPYGLQLEFGYDSGKAISSFCLTEEYEGYDNIIHGGIVAAILDEAMAKAILCNNIKAVTVNLNVSFNIALKPRHHYKVEGLIEAVKRKIILTKAYITDGDKTCAEGEAKFYVLEKQPDQG